VASGYYNDVLDRPTQVIRAANTSAEKSQSSFAYNDAAHVITTTSDLNSFNDNALKSEVVYDGLGRTIESRGYESPTNYNATRQNYDALGRSYQTSNPFRPLAPYNETPLWTTAAYDALGRVLTITTPDNAVVQTAYSGNTITVTDQAGKRRQSVTDAGGRLRQVYEDPSGLNYVTSYSYDVLGNLTQVNQGVQTRTFVYDSLSRLSSATNPESGAISYQYDNNGNLTQKTDARGIRATYSYDALNRNIDISYSDSTMEIGRAYDQTTNGRGRLSWEWQCRNSIDCGSRTQWTTTRWDE
jgi:YD repeat-containing protein